MRSLTLSLILSPALATAEVTASPALDMAEEAEPPLLVTTPVAVSQTLLRTPPRTPQALSVVGVGPRLMLRLRDLSLLTRSFPRPEVLTWAGMVRELAFLAEWTGHGSWDGLLI